VPLAFLPLPQALQCRLRLLKTIPPSLSHLISGIIAHCTSCVMRCLLARISPALSPSPLRSSIHSSYDDLPELVQFVPPMQSTPLIAAEIQSIDPPLSPAASASSSATSCAGSVASAAVGANQHAASPIVNIHLTEQSNSWAQVAHHLASGKWPAPQVLPLIVWCLTLLVLAC
jgi:hypothetical protein